MNRIIKICICSYTLLLIGCGSGDNVDNLVADKSIIEERLSQWNSSDIKDYTFSYYVDPTDCLAFTSPFPPRVITVENSVITNVSFSDNGSIIDNDLGVTINDIFTIMLDNQPRALSGSAEEDNVSLEFHNDFGYPERFYLVPSDEECGNTHLVFDFKVTPLTEEESSPKSIVQESISLWENSGIEDYSFTFYSTPDDCPVIDVFPPIEISVENSAVVSVYEPDSGQNLDLSNGMTMNSILSSLLEQAEMKPITFSRDDSDVNGLPEFNEDYGYPESVRIDMSTSECDATSYFISNFKIQQN